MHVKQRLKLIIGDNAVEYFMVRKQGIFARRVIFY
jgi:hypothetical protein